VVNRTVLALTLFLVAAPTVVANQPTGVNIVSPDELPPVVVGEYEVNVGDHLDVSFFKATQMSQERTVGPDGEIFLTLIGRVSVLGRTVEEITKELTQRYSVEMVNPKITVSVSGFSGLSVYVSGEVRGPGIRPYRGGLTLVQAISNAGGFTTRARRNSVLLIRRGPNNTPLGSVINVKQILRKGQLENDVPLAPLDTIYVHHKKITNANLFVQQYISANLPQLGSWFWWIPGYQTTANNQGN
jgi:polysaccharide export outer membrane protein